MKRNSSKPKRRYGDAGFTLVELVVVIAVLAILAGVGAVAYNGYIEYTQKGVDRNTVGEIYHALELANYDDPNLFSPNSETLVYITENGLVSTTSVEDALKNSFGDLTTVKLVYDKWPLGNMSGLDSIGTEDSNLANYYSDYVEKGANASFADDVDGLWNAVQDTITNWRKDHPGAANNYTQQAIDAAFNSSVPFTFDSWKNGEHVESCVGINNGQAASLARNYSFVAYAKSQELTPEMQKELDEFVKDNYGGFGVVQVTKEGSIRLMTGSKEYFTDSGWTSIRTSYFTSNQAAADAQAYLALMESAKSVGELTSAKTDDEYTEAMEKHLGTVSASIGNPDALESIKNIEGDFATIIVTKNTDGTIEPVIYPMDLRPTSDADSDKSEQVQYTNEITINYQASAPAGLYIGDGTDTTTDIAIPVGGKCTVYLKQKSAGTALPSAIVTSTLTNEGTIARKTGPDNNGKMEITGIEGGDAVLTITVNSKTVTINIRVC